MSDPTLNALLARRDVLEHILANIDIGLVIFGVFVVIGVGGESIFGIRAWRNNRKLHDVQQAIENIRQTEATEFNRQAELTAKAFESKIAESNAIAKTAEAQVASANARAQEAVAAAEHERLARLELEARLADRILTPQQQSALIAQVSPFRGVVIDVVIWGDTPEIQIIGGSILNALRKAGWTVNSGQAVGAGAAVRGILLGTRADSNPDTIRASATLISALRAAGLATDPWSFDELRTPNALMNSSFTGTAPLRMFIGAKP